jgi:hypothetical protein
VASYWPPRTDFVTSCVDAILSNVGAEGGRGDALDKIAVKHGASFFCAY